MSLTSKLAKKLSLVTLWISMGFSTLSAQQIFWDFNDGTTTDLTLQNIAVFTGNGTGEGAGGGRGNNFPGTALMFHPSGTRSVTMPAVDASSGTAELSFKMIYGNNSNGGENVDNGEYVLLEYSTLLLNKFLPIKEFEYSLIELLHYHRYQTHCFGQFPQYQNLVQNIKPLAELKNAH